MIALYSQLSYIYIYISSSLLTASLLNFRHTHPTSYLMLHMQNWTYTKESFWTSFLNLLHQWYFPSQWQTHHSISSGSNSWTHSSPLILSISDFHQKFYRLHFKNLINIHQLCCTPICCLLSQCVIFHNCPITHPSLTPEAGLSNYT